VCAIDNIQEEIITEMLKSDSIQPNILGYENEKVEEISMNFYISMIFLLCICVLTILSFSKTRNLVEKIDLYSLQHNYDDDRAIYIRKTLIGGIFTIVFIFGAIAVVFNMLLSYSLDNIRETKGLVPYFSVEQEYKDVIFK
jgi:hypothetical protein